MENKIKQIAIICSQINLTNNTSLINMHVSDTSCMYKKSKAYTHDMSLVSLAVHDINSNQPLRLDLD